MGWCVRSSGVLVAHVPDKCCQSHRLLGGNGKLKAYINMVNNDLEKLLKWKSPKLRFAQSMSLRACPSITNAESGPCVSGNCLLKTFLQLP